MSKNNWFSNFAPSPIFMGKFTYPTIEHAFQAAKTLDIKEKKHIANISSPEKAKKNGRNLGLRADWEEIKLAVMYISLCTKFCDENWYKELKLTGEEEIIEWNNWGLQLFLENMGKPGNLGGNRCRFYPMLKSAQIPAHTSN